MKFLAFNEFQVVELWQAQSSPDYAQILVDEYEATLSITDGELLSSSLPKKKLKMVQAWIAIHEDELMADWKLASDGKEPFKVSPLK